VVLRGRGGTEGGTPGRRKLLGVEKRVGKGSRSGREMRLGRGGDRGGEGPPPGLPAACGA